MENKTYDIEALQAQASENARNHFRQGLNCAESVFQGFLDLGLTDLPKEVIALASGFGGGIGHTKHACGCVTGAVMAIGTQKGRKNPMAKEEPKDRILELNEEGGTYSHFARFINEFEDRFGTIECSELTSKHDDWFGKERRKSCMQLVEYCAECAVKYSLD